MSAFPANAISSMAKGRIVPTRCGRGQKRKSIRLRTFSEVVVVFLVSATRLWKE
jgi:hypothetical protein